MKFKDYKYERPNYEEIKKSFLELVDKIKNASTYDEQKLHINQLNNIRKHIDVKKVKAPLSNTKNFAFCIKGICQSWI